jgi:hypothetical protein
MDIVMSDIIDYVSLSPKTGYTDHPAVIIASISIASPFAGFIAFLCYWFHPKTRKKRALKRVEMLEKTEQRLADVKKR